MLGRRAEAKALFALFALALLWMGDGHAFASGTIAAVRAEVMTVDGGIRAGCYILSRYIRAEKSVTSALGRYFSRLDGNYILRKVLASALTFEQYRTGMLPIDGVKTAHEKESKTMGLLISYAPAPTKRPPSSKGVRVVNSSVPKKNSYAKISAASPPKEMTVFKRK